MRRWKRTPAAGHAAPAPLITRSFGPTLFQLAYLATGDTAAADRLAYDAVVDEPGEGLALRKLAAALQAFHGGWPAAAPPPPTANRLDQQARSAIWKALGELTPAQRLALGLHLWLRVPRGALDEWAGTRGAAEQVGTFFLHTAQALDRMPAPSPAPECQAVAPKLADVDDPERGRGARLHLLGCAACAARVEELRRATEVVREALQASFPPRQPAPPLALPTRKRRVPRFGGRWLEIGAITCIVLLAAVLLIWQPARPRTRGTVENITAETVIDRALRRFDPGTRQGVLHERYRAGSGADAIIGERWITYATPQRMRLTLQRAADQAPLLDLTTDGLTRLRYTARQDETISTTTEIDDARVQKLLPLLRQLPAAGPLGSFPSSRVPYDLGLIGAARREQAVLLGTARVIDRPAYLLAYTEPEGGGRTVLSMDAETWSLLRATTSAGTGMGPATMLWQAETVEVLAQAPPRTFDLAAATANGTLPDPRHLLLQPFSNLSINDVARRYVKFPLPAGIPDGTAIAYLRDADLFGTVQLYEGDWTSVAIIARLSESPVRAEPAFDQRAGGTIWRLVRTDSTRGITVIDFAPADEPTRRSQLYIWHVWMSDEERLAQAKRILAGMQWLDSQQLATFRDRFVTPPQGAVAAAGGPHIGLWSGQGFAHDAGRGIGNDWRAPGGGNSGRQP